MADRPNIPVLVGAVPLFAVTSFVLNEGFKIVPIAGNPSTQLKQLVAPTTKTITIEALLIEEFRALRPALEAMALTLRLPAWATGSLMKFTGMKFTGIAVAAKNGVHLDMQISSLVFTQDNQMRDTLRVSMTLTHVPRSRLGGIFGGALNLAVGAGTAFI